MKRFYLAFLMVILAVFWMVALTTPVKSRELPESHQMPTERVYRIPVEVDTN